MVTNFSTSACTQIIGHTLEHFKSKKKLKTWYFDVALTFSNDHNQNESYAFNRTKICELYLIKWPPEENC